MYHVIVAATFVSCLLLGACGSSPFLDRSTLPAANQRDMLTKTAADDTARKTKKSPEVNAKLVAGDFVTRQTSELSGPPRGVRLAGDSSAARGMFNAPDRGSTPVVGSAQWDQEKAEDARREKELLRKLQICKC